MIPRRVLLFGCFLLLATFCGCGGGSSNGAPTFTSAPDFDVTVQPSSLSMVPGTSCTVTISVAPLNGFNGTVALTAALPSGVTVAPGLPQNVGSSGLILTITIPADTKVGSLTIPFQATSGTHTHNSNLTLTSGTRADVTISVPAAKVHLARGATTQIPVGFDIDAGVVDYQIQLQATTPTGVTATFAHTTIRPPGQEMLTLTASNTAAIGDAVVSVDVARDVDAAHVYGGFTVSIDPQPGTIAGNRSDWVRLGSNPIAAVYDAARKHVFVSVPALNLLKVVDPSSGNTISDIAISLSGYEPNGMWLPGGSSLSITPDGNYLLAIGPGRISTVDLATLQVVKQQPLPKATPLGRTQPEFIHHGFLVAAAGGKIVMGTKGDAAFYYWDGMSAEATYNLLSDVYSIDRNFDGSKVLINSGDSSGAYELMDVATGQIITRGAYSGEAVWNVRGNPAKDEWAIATSHGIDFLDGNLNRVGSVPAGLVGSASYWGMTYSSDGKYLYLGYKGDLPWLITIDTATHRIMGYAPATGTDIAYFQREPPEFIAQPFAADDSGLVFGLGEKGLVIDDATYFIDPARATSSYSAILADPDSGRLLGGTTTRISTQSYAAKPDVWFSGQRAASVSMDVSGSVSAVTPAAQKPGPVNIKVFPPDGYAHVMPQAFTYGTIITSVRNSICSVKGGCSADIFGFGLFGADLKQTSVTVGGNAATVQSEHYFNADRAYPYPLQYVTVTVPPGLAGRADISVTTAVGADTLKAGFLYAKSVESYASTNAYNALLWDRKRGVLYASTDTTIARYSPATKTFLAALAPPTVNGRAQFSGLALTPDGSKLLVANKLDQSVAVINPDNPSEASAVPLPVAPNTVGPQFIAATSTGKAFVSQTTLTLMPTSGQLFELDLSTMQMRSRTDENVFWLRDPGMLAGTASGTKVIAHGYGGPVLMWSADTDSFDMAWSIGLPGAAICAAAGDGNVFAAGQGLTDGALNTITQMGFPDELAMEFNASQPTDVALNDAGSLWIAPYGTHLSIFDTAHGWPLWNMALPNRMNMWTKVVAVDDTGQTIFLSDTNGLTVIQLASAPLSVGSILPATIPTTGGTITVRGSGFLPGTTVTAGGKSATVQYVDSSTLNVAVPAGVSGGTRVVVRNPDAEVYTLDNALAYQ